MGVLFAVVCAGLGLLGAGVGLILYVTVLAARRKRHQVFSHLGKVKEAK